MYPNYIYHNSTINPFTSMPQVNAIEFVLLWDQEKSQYKERIIDFWKELQALPTNVSARDRLTEVVYVALLEGKVIGVNSAFEAKVAHLSNSPFINYRILLHPEFRIPGLVDKMGVLAIQYFNELYQSGTIQSVGVITLIENQWYKNNRREAVWPSTGFVYIGDSPAGHHIRLKYFDGAKF